MCEILKNDANPVTSLTFESLEKLYDNQSNGLNWNCVFVLPCWLRSWMAVFGKKDNQLILAVSSEGRLLGVAPLIRNGANAGFMGGENICDYQDMIINPGREDLFFSILLPHLKKTGIKKLTLGALKPDSAILGHLNGAESIGGYPVSYEEAGKLFEMDLPETWNDYLNGLKGKQRHEVRRKLRRLEEAGAISYRVIKDQPRIMEAYSDFLSLFQASRRDKAEFLTDQMKSFFNHMVHNLSGNNLIKIGILTINGIKAAATLCFEYRDAILLYNNGYDPGFAHLSVGAVSKVLDIKDSISNEVPRYSFLKGDEIYKQRLGGIGIPLKRIKIDL